MKKVPYKYGFTLIELILVTAILAVIGMAVFGTFANGIKIWRTVTQESINEDINIFFEKISLDLRNSFKLTEIRFRGGKNKVSFPVKIKTRDDDGIKDSIGEVTYSYDRRKKTINKRQATYSEVYRKKPGKRRILKEEISSLNFKYFVYDPDRKRYSWVTSWQEEDLTLGRQVEENLPLIVRIEVGIPKTQGEQKFVKNVAIPSACCWPFLEDSK